MRQVSWTKNTSGVKISITIRAVPVHNCFWFERGEVLENVVRHAMWVLRKQAAAFEISSLETDFSRESVSKFDFIQ